MDESVISFPRSISIEACEKFIRSIETSGTSIDLQLPVGTAGYATSFGGLASAIQAINTWVRQSEKRKLSLSSSSSNDEIEDLMQRPHKFAAAMAAKSIVVSNAPDMEVRPKVNAEAKLAIESQAHSQFGQQRGGLCWFAFVDHSSKGFDPNFYIEKINGRVEIRQQEQFKAVVNTMVGRALMTTGGAKNLDPVSLDALGRIFYELFLNTHEHGSRGTERSTWLKPGIRMIYVQAINLTRTSAESATENQPILSKYLESVSENYSSGAQTRFVEIGIVDSGLGYSGRWLADNDSTLVKEDMPIAKEYEIFKQCFRFRQTSTGRDSKGNGLPVVMDKLTKLGGFMRIRSGRLGLYRNFVSQPYGADDLCVFSDWDSGQSAESSVTTMSKASGVAISLLIPLEAK